MVVVGVAQRRRAVRARGGLEVVQVEGEAQVDALVERRHAQAA